MLNTAAEPQRRRRLPGVDIRPGSVKQARAEAGLSLAELAGGRVTRAAIHLVETGRSRPSMPLLEMIADRTGKPVAWFLDPAARAHSSDLQREARIGELEALCEARDYAAARTLAEELLSTVKGEEAEARVRHYLGRALVRLLEPDEALPHLRRAERLFDALEDHVMAVETLDWIAGALHQLEDTSAIALEEEALRRCQALDPVPIGTEIRILTNLATLRAARHEWPAAIKLYERVLERGADITDVERLARVYMGMAKSYRNLGDLNRAVSYTQRAVAFHELQRDQTALCQAEEQLGRLLLRHDDLGAAADHLRRALDAAERIGNARILRHVRLAMSELFLRRGDVDPAQRLALDVVEEARGERHAATEAEAHALLGRAQALAGSPDGADQHFEAALGLLEVAGLTEQLIETHHAYAGVLRERGETARAYEQLEAAMQLSRPGLAGPRSAPAAGRSSTLSA